MFTAGCSPRTSFWATPGSFAVPNQRTPRCHFPGPRLVHIQPVESLGAVSVQSRGLLYIKQNNEYSFPSTACLYRMEASSLRHQHVKHVCFISKEPPLPLNKENASDSGEEDMGNPSNCPLASSQTSTRRSPWSRRLAPLSACAPRLRGLLVP